MARLILKNCFVEINMANVSDHCSSAEIDLSKDDIDVTNFGGAGREHAAGLQDNSIVLNLQQDFEAASVDSIFYPLWDQETEFDVVIRPTADAASATNPEYSATCLLLEYKPLSGDVGSLSEVSITAVVQRGSFARATS
jgi:UTP:GlnB (protein PII) uridylyltransferase